MLRFRSLIVLSFFSLFTLFSCGGENSKSTARSIKLKKEITSKNENSTSCLGITCLSSIDWKLYLQGKSFPDRVKLMINQDVVINECLGKQKYHVSRGLNPQMIYLDLYKVPSTQKVLIEVVDLGADCMSESTFLKDEFEYEVSKKNEYFELMINL